MDALPNSSAPEPEKLAGALDRLWERFLPQIQQRVALIESAAKALRDGMLTTSQQQAAHAAAHKLAGTLGSFGLMEGTTQAREIEIRLAREAAPRPDQAEHLLWYAASLRTLIESRNRPPSPAH